MSLYKLLSLIYSTNIFIKGINILLQGFPNIKNVFSNFCGINDEHFSDFEFRSIYKFSIINFSNNKIYKLKSFEKDTTTQLILKIYKYINNKFLLFSLFYLKSLNNIEIIALKIKSLFFIFFIILLLVIFNFIVKSCLHILFSIIISQ